MGSEGRNRCSNCKDKPARYRRARHRLCRRGMCRGAQDCARGSGLGPSTASPCHAGSSHPGKNSREVLQSVGHFSLSPLGLSGWGGVTPCRRVDRLSKEWLWEKKNIFFSQSDPPVLSVPRLWLAAQELGSAKGLGRGSGERGGEEIPLGRATRRALPHRHQHEGWVCWHHKNGEREVPLVFRL